MSKNLNTETTGADNTLSKESVEALMKQAGETIKKSVPAQTTEEPTVVEADQDPAENGDDTETTSKLADLKAKALKVVKNKKFLIGTGAVVALGVIVKIALGQPTDEEEPVEADDENDEPETSEV